MLSLLKRLRNRLPGLRSKLTKVWVNNHDASLASTQSIPYIPGQRAKDQNLRDKVDAVRGMADRLSVSSNMGTRHIPQKVGPAIRQSGNSYQPNEDIPLKGKPKLERGFY